MTKLLEIRTVYDIDPSKTFRVADILEAGAILPHSVNICELMVCELVEIDENYTGMMSQLQDAGFGSAGVM